MTGRAARDADGGEAGRARPFLKWAGGKRQLLPEIRPFYPARFDTYWEPFLGSGAVFFDLCRLDRVRRGRVVLIDANRDLIVCYRALRDRADAVVAALRDLEHRHRRDPAACFYDVRERFNRVRTEASGRVDEAELGAMVIYLNRTGFNGLYRLNARGAFNVPMGRYRNPRICDETNLRAVGDALARLDVDLRHGSYDEALDARAGDFVYLDPPYAPVSSTAAFRSYTASGFTSADQARLQGVVLQLASRGCAVVLSNSAVPEIERLYEQNAEARRAGLRVTRVKARRAINSRADARGEIDELLITAGPPAG